MSEFQQLRERAGLSKRALAKRWGVSRQAVQNFETGRKQTPSGRWSDLVQIAGGEHGSQAN